MPEKGTDPVKTDSDKRLQCCKITTLEFFVIRNCFTVNFGQVMPFGVQTYQGSIPETLFLCCGTWEMIRVMGIPPVTTTIANC